jgi:hypothetical protein
MGTGCLTQPILTKKSWSVARSWTRGFTTGSIQPFVVESRMTLVPEAGDVLVLED